MSSTTRRFASRLLSIIACLLLSPATAALAQRNAFDFGSRIAIESAARTAADSTGAGDMRLVMIEPHYSFDFAAGTARSGRYTFYSPSRRLVIHVLDTMSGTTANLYGAMQYELAAGAAEPIALDTVGIDLRAATFVQALRNDAAYASYRAATPGAPRTVVLRMPGGPATYPVPPGISPTEPVWIAFNDPKGDSVFICMYAPRTGVVACSTHYSLDELGSTRPSTRGDAAFIVASDGRWVFDGSYETPRGSRMTYFGGAGLWFGARTRIDGELTPRVFITYNPNSGVGWGAPGEARIPRSSLPRAIAYSSAAHDVASGAPVGSEPYAWPLWIESPTDVPTYMRPGTFVPHLAARFPGGDFARPSFVAGVEEQFVSRYHDERVDRYEIRDELKGFPLGLQFQEDVFLQPGGMPGTVFVRYAIVNVSNDTLFDVVAAPMADWDIGSAQDDGAAFYAGRPELRTVYAWSGFESQGLRAMVLTLLEAPMVDAGGRVDNTRRADYRTEGRLATFNAWTIRNDPYTSAGRYEMLANGELDSTTAVGDYRGTLGPRPFMMLPGDTAYVAAGYSVVARRSHVDSTVTKMMELYYSTNPRASVAVAAAADARLAAMPNPAREHVTLQLSGPATTGATLRLTDALGRVHARRAIEQGISVVELDLRHLEAGRYIATISDASGVAAVQLIVVR